MARIAVALVVEVVLAILVALGLGTVLQWMLGAGGLAASAAESARLLFFFMDIGLAVWVVILIVLVVRRRTHPTVGATLLAAVVGVAVNALTVLAVSLVQGGGTAEFLTYALEAGAVFLIAVLVVAPIIRRLFRAPVKPPA
jgi:hypothetical protein